MTKARDIASASPAPSTISATELGYLDGVSSAIQTQIDSKIGSASAINPNIVDAKGDLIAGTGADAVSRLAVGTNGQTLVADSGETTGLKWGSPNAVGCAVYSTTTQSLTNNTLTALTFDAETYDTNAFHSTSTNTSRITIPTGYGGKYRIGGLVSFHPNATGRRELQLYKNGAVLSYGNTVIGNGAEFIGTYMDWSTTLVAGDYVELYALQSSGGALTVYTTILNCQFSIDYLGA